jgi:hypothetical protein
MLEALANREGRHGAIAEYEDRDALGLAAWVRAREVSPLELLEAAVERVEQRNPALNAVVVRAFEEGRKAIEAGLPDGPFRGVPWLLKDLHAAWTGVRLSSGSRFFADNVSDYDSELTLRYRRAGLVLFGRTASPEFGLTSTTESTLYGDTHNPWNLAHTTGGSSGGAAAVVAAGIVPAAHRDGRRRLDPRARVVLRAVRHEAHARARAVGTEGRRGLERHERAARGLAQRARQRGAARRGGGPCARRPLRRAAARAAVPRGGRRQPGPAAHRPADDRVQRRRGRPRLPRGRA